MKMTFFGRELTYWIRQQSFSRIPWRRKMPTDAEVLLCTIISVSVLSGAEAAGRNGQGISPGRGPDPQTRHHVLRVHNTRRPTSDVAAWISILPHPAQHSWGESPPHPPSTSVSSRSSGTNYTVDWLHSPRLTRVEQSESQWLVQGWPCISW